MKKKPVKRSKADQLMESIIANIADKLVGCPRFPKTRIALFVPYRGFQQVRLMGFKTEDDLMGFAIHLEQRGIDWFGVQDEITCLGPDKPRTKKKRKK